MTDDPVTGTSEDPMIAALLREREAYVRFGKDERVAAVDEQLRLRGHVEDPRHTAPRGRSGKQQQTTDAGPADEVG